MAEENFQQQRPAKENPVAGCVFLYMRNMERYDIRKKLCKFK